MFTGICRTIHFFFKLMLGYYFSDILLSAHSIQALYIKLYRKTRFRFWYSPIALSRSLEASGPDGHINKSKH